jgi:hypothetical protein
VYESFEGIGTSLVRAPSAPRKARFRRVCTHHHSPRGAASASPSWAPPGPATAGGGKVDHYPAGRVQHGADLLVQSARGAEVASASGARQLTGEPRDGPPVNGPHLARAHRASRSGLNRAWSFGRCDVCGVRPDRIPYDFNLVRRAGLEPAQE